MTTTTTRATTRAIIYARVSTKDQKCASQLAECRSYIARQKDWELTGEYIDAGISGKTTSRKELDRCMADAAKRKFDVVIVYKLDRWGRSMIHICESVMELDRIGVRFVAISQGIDTDKSSSASRLQLRIMAAFAEFEREIIGERSLSGIHATIAAGNPFGRPRRVFRVDLAKELREKGFSWRETAERVGVSVTTLRETLDPDSISASKKRIREERRQAREMAQ